MLDFTLAFFVHLSKWAWFLTLVFGGGWIVCSIAYWINDIIEADEKEKTYAKKEAQEIKRVAGGFRRIAGPFFFVCLFLSCVPTIDDVWKVRIGLIKFGLASPDNVKSGVETIERVGKKLECKYLGGCEEEKKNDKESK